MNTNVKMEEVQKKTYPQIKAIMQGAGKWLPMKWGVGGIGSSSGDGEDDGSDTGERTVEGTSQFVQMFKGIK